MTPKSAIPCGVLFVRKVMWWTMYSVGFGAASAACPRMPRVKPRFTLAPLSTLHSAERLPRGDATWQQSGKSNPVHEERRPVRGEHRPWRGPHPVPYRDEQSDHQQELCDFAGEEHGEDQRCAARNPAERNDRHRKARDRADPAAEQRRDGSGCTVDEEGHERGEERNSRLPEHDPERQPSRSDVWTRSVRQL